MIDDDMIGFVIYQMHVLLTSCIVMTFVMIFNVGVCFKKYTSCWMLCNVQD